MSDTREHNCATTCPIAEAQSRREFLRDSALGIAGILATLGVASSASALPVSLIKAAVRGKAGLTYPIPATDGVQIDKDNEVILVRWAGAMYAFNLSCPHQHTALRWNDSVKEFQCPKHKSKYQPTGDFISGRATRAMDRFAVQKNANNIVVNVDAMYQEDEQNAQWKAAFIKV